MRTRRRRWLAWVLVAAAGLGAAVGLSRWRRRAQKQETGNERPEAPLAPAGPAPSDVVPVAPEVATDQAPAVTFGPLISVIVTTSDVTLADAVAALEQQHYRDWELLAVVVDAGPPPVPNDGRISVVLAPVADRRTGERLALGRAKGQIVTRGLPADPSWLSGLARRWQEDAGRVGPEAMRAEDAFSSRLAPHASPAVPGPPGLPAFRLARADAEPGVSRPRRPALASAGG